MKLTNTGFLLQSRDALSDCHRFENKFYGLAVRRTIFWRNWTNTELHDNRQGWPTYIRKKFRDGGNSSSPQNTAICYDKKMWIRHQISKDESRSKTEEQSDCETTISKNTKRLNSTSRVQYASKSTNDLSTKIRIKIYHWKTGNDLGHKPELWMQEINFKVHQPPMFRPFLNWQKTLKPPKFVTLVWKPYFGKKNIYQRKTENLHTGHQTK